MNDLVQGCIIIGLVIALYFLGKTKGKDNATIEFLKDENKEKDDREQFIHSRMQRFEDKVAKFEKNNDSVDYSNATDAELEQLRQGKTLTDFTEGTDENTTVDGDATIGTTGKIQGSD